MNADRQAGLHQPKVLEAKANAFPANHVEDFDGKA
jgi:hypothetical protein